MFALSNKIAVITGGESGIGRAIAESFSRQGATVILAGVLQDLGAEAEAAIGRTGGRCTFLKMDVRSSAEVNATLDAVVKQHGGLDILVNCAGVSDGRAMCLETSDELFDTVVDINLRGAFYATRAALRTMVERKSGRIINVASIAALRVSINGLPYTISKFGLVGLTRHTATHYADAGITVNAICPGFTSTDMLNNSRKIVGELAPAMARAVGASPDAFKQYVPAQRRGTVEEIAALAVFFASDEAAYITGQVTAVDGGLSAS